MSRLILATLLWAGCDTAQVAQQDMFPDLTVVDLAGREDLAGSSSDLAGNHDLSAAPNVLVNGFISVYSYSFTTSGIPVMGGGASASFTTVTYPSDLICVATTVGICRVQTCNGNLLGASSVDDNVGNFGFTINGVTRTFSPSASNQYAPLSSPGPLFHAGDTVTFNLPGLSAITVTGPAEPTLTGPTPPPTPNKVLINEANDLPVTFTGGSAGSTATITLSGSSSSTNSVSASCSGDPSSGTITVPKAALQSLPKGAGSMSIVVAGKTSASFMGHDTTLQASNGVLLPSGDSYGGADCTFQ